MVAGFAEVIESEATLVAEACNQSKMHKAGISDSGLLLAKSSSELDSNLRPLG
jgi:hypothetical protein